MHCIKKDHLDSETKLRMSKTETEKNDLINLFLFDDKVFIYLPCPEHLTLTIFKD